jgi:hypothetical protein
LVLIGSQGKIHVHSRDIGQVVEMSAKRFAGITIIAYYRGLLALLQFWGSTGRCNRSFIKPFSFVAPASRMPESAERTCASFIHYLAKPVGSYDPRLCTRLLGRSAGPCFPKHKSNLFCCLSNFRRKNLDLPRTTGLHPDFLALHQ